MGEGVAGTRALARVRAGGDIDMSGCGIYWHCCVLATATATALRKWK